LFSLGVLGITWCTETWWYILL